LDHSTDMKAAWIEEERACRANFIAAESSPRSVLAHYDGLDFLQAIRRGEIGPAPIAGTMNITLIAAEAGKVTFQGSPTFDHTGKIYASGTTTCLIFDIPQ
jgi:hypothetical protein